MDVLRRFVLLPISALVVACAAEPDVDSAGTMGTNAEAENVLLRNVYLVASGAGGYSAGDDGLVRLWLFNEADVGDALVDVRSPTSEAARIAWDRDCDGVYETVDELPLRANAGVPYGTPYAVELVNFTGEVHGGTTVPITFTFRKAGEVTVDALVEAVNDGDVTDPVRCPATSTRVG